MSEEYKNGYLTALLWIRRVLTHDRDRVDMWVNDGIGAMERQLKLPASGDPGGDPPAPAEGDPTKGP